MRVTEYFVELLKIGEGLSFIDSSLVIRHCSRISFVRHAPAETGGVFGHVTRIRSAHLVVALISLGIDSMQATP